MTPFLNTSRYRRPLAALAFALLAPGVRADEPGAKYVLQADGTVTRQVAELKRELAGVGAELAEVKVRLAALERAAGAPPGAPGTPVPAPAGPAHLVIGGVPHQLRADGRYWPLAVPSPVVLPRAAPAFALPGGCANGRCPVR